jgi:hypothetical protein
LFADRAAEKDRLEMLQSVVSVSQSAENILNLGFGILAVP